MLMRIKNLLERNAYGIAIALTIFITITSLISLKGIKTIDITIRNSDKIAHFISYFTLTIAWFFALQHILIRQKSKLILILLIIFYGILIEALQGGMTTHRQADIYDVLANSTGVLLAAALFSKLNHWFNSI